MGFMQGNDEAAKDPLLQETVVLHYFNSLMKHAESLNNPEVLARCKERQLPNLVVTQTLYNLDSYDMDTKTAIVEGFAALANNEDFQPTWEEFFDDKQKADFLQLEERLARGVVQNQPELMKDVRPIFDFFNKMKRSMR